jgi:hypothetical protein
MSTAPEDTAEYLGRTSLKRKSEDDTRSEDLFQSSRSDGWVGIRLVEGDYGDDEESVGRYSAVRSPLISLLVDTNSCIAAV